MSSAFDPSAFLDAQITEVLIKRPPVPVGDYTAVIGDITARTWQGVKDPSKSGIAWDIPLTVELPPEVQTALGIDKSTISMKDSIMIDLNDAGMIDTGVGKNNRLRAYREACNLNNPGDVFSARKMVGAVITVKIKHGVYNDLPTEEIGAVARG